MLEPLVSFIIPCYNQGDYIQETVNSIRLQSYANYEIIVVDDGSTDKKTHEILEGLAAADLKIIYQNNAGPSIARNIAVNVSAGKYLVPLDGDDLILKNTLKKAVGILEKDEGVAVVYGDNILFGSEERVKHQAPFSIKNTMLFNSVAFCSVIRKEAYVKIGGLDEFMSKKGLEDWEFWIRLYKHGWRLHYLNELFFKIRVLPNSRTFEVANKNLKELKSYVWKKHFDLFALEYEKMYHENKNIKKTLNYKLGEFLLAPLRMVVKLIRKNGSGKE